MTIEIRPGRVVFSDGTQQTQPAGVLPGWANITGRPGDFTNAPWTFTGAVSGGTAGRMPMSRNGGVVSNCGSYNYGYTSYFKLHPNPATSNGWDMFYAIINCYDCANCNC
jgi:hypothetical protein